MADLMKALRNAHKAGDTNSAKRIAAMINAQQQPETTLAEDVVGGLETGASIVSGAIAEPLAGIAGVAQSLNPFADEGAGAEAVQATREALTYQPQTEAGQQQQQAVGEALAPIGEAVSGVESALGQGTLDMTGSPFLASIAHSLPTAALEVLGFKGSKAITKAKPKPSKKQVQKSIVESAPEIDALKGAASAVYDEIDSSGVRIKKGPVNSLVNRIEAKTKKSGLDSRVTKQASGALEALKEIKDADQPITELMTQKKIAQNVASSIDPAEKMLGNIMIDEIDGFIDSLSSGQLSKGDAATGKKVRSASQLWGRAKRAEMINEAIELGGSAASGAENGIRVKFRQILNNKKKSKFLTGTEKAAMKDVVDGDFKTNFAKFIGRTGGFEGASTNMLGTLGGSAAGGAIAGPVGAFAVPVAGMAAKSIAQKLTKNKAQFSSKIAAAGKDANRIAKAYLTSVQKKKRNPSDLADLLLDPKVNIDDLEVIANETFKDALDIAKGKRAINLASAATAGTLTGEQERAQ